MRDLAKGIESALDARGGKNSSLKCFPTHIPSLPTGEECGRYLSLELTTSSIKISLVDFGLTPENPSYMMYPYKTLTEAPKDIHIFELSDKLKTGKSKGEKLFDRLAECLKEFLQEKQLEATQLQLAFTFPFAVDQESLTKGKLVSWNKGFNCSGVVGEDVVVLLEDSLKKLDLKNIEVSIIILRTITDQFQVCAVVNNAAGYLVSCAWENKNCRVGVVLNSGTNACYVKVKVSEIKILIYSLHNTQDTNGIVNTEWGAFGDGGELSFIETK